MSVEVFIPANFVASGWGTPTVCARHGEPATEKRSIQFASRASLWLLLGGVAVYFIVAGVTRKTVWAQAWPYCPRCKKDRATKTAVGWAGVVVGLALWVTCRLLLREVAVTGATLGPLVFVAGAVLAGRGTRRAITGGVVTSDARSVRFARAHETFASQAAAAQQAAAQHYAQSNVQSNVQPNVQPDPA